MSRKFLFVSCLLIVLVQAFGIHHVLRRDEMGRPGEDIVNEHHDLRVLVHQLREEKAPIWKWFVSDWPLYNGLYRPMPTLSVALDDVLFGDDLNKYKIQNWLIALTCSFALFWFVWELFRLKWLSLGCSVLYGAWQSGIENAIPIEWIALGCGIIIAVYGIVFGRPSGLKWALVAAAIVYLGREYALVLQHRDVTAQPFDFRTIAWPVGRTATLMTLFALVSLAAYCRYERLRKPTYIIVSIVALILAFCSYEQAVVIPALLLACGLALRVQGVTARWSFHLFFWAVLGLYLWLHLSHLQVDSPYRMQAVRGYAGGVRDITVWLFPSYFHFSFLRQIFEPNLGVAVLVQETYVKAVADTCGNLCALIIARKRWLYVGFGLIAAVGSYAPMAFLHPLSHYFHLPLAMRAIFVISLSWACFERLRELETKRHLPARSAEFA